MYKYLFGIIIILGFALGISLSNASKQKSRANRMTEQYQKLENDSKQLTLTYKELTKDQAERISRLADSLNVKPKFIKEYVNIYITDTIVDTVYAEVIKVDSNTYKFSKDTACFNINGLVKLTGRIPQVAFTHLEYKNNIEYIVYLNRKEWQIWFIKSKFLGRKYTDLKVIQDCGETKVEDVQLIKK